MERTLSCLIYLSSMCINIIIIIKHRRGTGASLRLGNVPFKGRTLRCLAEVRKRVRIYQNILAAGGK